MISETKLITISNILNFISELDHHQKKTIMSHAVIKEYDKDKILINIGSICSQIFFVLSGKIRVYKISSEGREVKLYNVNPGETCLMSLSCMFSKEHYPAISSVEENIEILVLNENTFKEIFFKNVVLQGYVFHEVLVKMKKVMDRFEDITFKKIDERICEYLNEKRNSNNIITITHEKIAYEIGTTRVVVSRVLKDLESKGFVELSRGKILIKNNFM